MKERCFSPGEPVFLQGQCLPEFFGVTGGRFALVRSSKGALGLSQIEFLSQARLLGIVTKDEIFGELGALLCEPQPFSAFALDAGAVQSLSAQDADLNATMSKTPQFGVKTCISFAGHLKMALDQFSTLVKECELIDQAIRNGSRSFLILLKELEQSHGEYSENLLRFARGHRACTTAQQLAQALPERSPGTSVVSAALNAPMNCMTPVFFPAGTRLCQKGNLGDRLFVITEGIVEVHLGGGASVTINRRGSIIGEIAVFLNLATNKPEVRRTADVICTTPVKAIVVGMDSVESYFAQHTELMTSMLSAMVLRTKETRLLLDTYRNKLHSRLNEELRPLLEGHHEISHLLAESGETARFTRSLNLTATQARQIYDRFATTLQTLQKLEATPSEAGRLAAPGFASLSRPPF